MLWCTVEAAGPQRRQGGVHRDGWDVHGTCRRIQRLLHQELTRRAVGTHLQQRSRGRQVTLAKWFYDMPVKYFIILCLLSGMIPLEILLCGLCRCVSSRGCSFTMCSLPHFMQFENVLPFEIYQAGYWLAALNYFSYCFFFFL